MDPRLYEVRKRFLEDYDFYSPKALKIRTKTGDITPLVPKPAQRLLRDMIARQLADTGMVRIVILKARQQGLSTDVAGFMYFQVSQRKGAKALVMAHSDKTATSLFDIVKRYHTNCPDALRPSTKYSSRKELVFDRLDSSYMVATAGGDGVGRGETITHLHASEMAFWPPAKADEIWGGLGQSIARKPGTAIFVESTANGMSGPFYELCQGALKGENDFELLFIPWFLDPDYSIDPPESFKLTKDEEALKATYSLTDGQLYWRRRKIADHGANGEDWFKQEYPATPEEAFLASGRPVFHLERVHDLLKAAKKPQEVKRYALYSNGWEEDPRGELMVYQEPNSKASYVIGADVAKGIRGADYSVAIVMDQQRNVVAKWRGYLVPDKFAEVLDALGYRYNSALLVPENNDHGVLTCYRLEKEFNYPFLFRNTQYDKVTDKETVTVGFTTNVKTKPLILDKLRASVRDRLVSIEDYETLQEMLTYIVTESGKMEADKGCHDDCVMALALAHHGVELIASPVAPTDDYYATEDDY